MANAIVSTVNPKARATPRKPIPRLGNAAARTALPHPPKTSQNVPRNSAAALLLKGMSRPPVTTRWTVTARLPATKPIRGMRKPQYLGWKYTPFGCRPQATMELAGFTRCDRVPLPHRARPTQSSHGGFRSHALCQDRRSRRRHWGALAHAARGRNRRRRYSAALSGHRPSRPSHRLPGPARLARNRVLYG